MTPVLAPQDGPAIARMHGERDALIARLVAVDPAALGDADRVTCALLRGQLEADRGQDICRFWEWNVASDSQRPAPAS